jgi:hypothetical protein
MKSPLRNPIILAAILAFLTLGLSLQSYFVRSGKHLPGGHPQTHYNNYMIFARSFDHLSERQDLYCLFPDQHEDLFKYSPTFAFLMAPLAVLPDLAGLMAWNLLNILILFFALWKFPWPTNRVKGWMCLLVLAEAVTAIQNSQSNALMAGLILFAFLSLEKKQPLWAALFISLTIFIKVFGVVALALFLLYPRKFRSALYTLGWILLLAAFPLAVVPLSELAGLYASWIEMMRTDVGSSLGLSVAGWLQAWFGWESKWLILGIGFGLFFLPFLNYKSFADPRYKKLLLASALLWMVLFNFKAESPTYVIAVAGVAVWLSTTARTGRDIALATGVLVFTVLSPTELFPAALREHFFQPLMIKVVPCFLVWLRVLFDMLAMRRPIAAPTQKPVTG